MKSLETKADIRKRILKIRETQPIELQKEKSMWIQKKVIQNAEFVGADWIYLYMDYRGEVQTGWLLEEALKLGKKVALPRVQNGEMDFYEVTSKAQVQAGYFGIPEPVTSKVVEEGHGFMTVPGVVFSKNNYRIGYGKGFYDRYLSRYPEIYTCGLAYGCQMLESVPADSHDIQLKEVIYR